MLLLTREAILVHVARGHGRSANNDLADVAGGSSRPDASAMNSSPARNEADGSRLRRPGGFAAMTPASLSP